MNEAEVLILAVKELEAAILVLWGEMRAPQVKILREERPEVVALCQRIHEQYDHAESAAEEATWD